MSCFSLSSKTCHRIEQRLGNFYWGSVNGERKLHWRSWDRMCLSKNNGGMGFRRLQNFNRAMLAKQAWRLLVNPESLAARVFKSKYYPRSCLLQAADGYNPSYTWRSIKSGLDLLQNGVEWRIGTGDAVNIWRDSWIPGIPSGRSAYLYPGRDHLQTVAELTVAEPLRWNETLIDEVFTSEDATAIKAIYLSPRNPVDVIRWKHTATGCYSIRSGYHTDLNLWWASSGRQVSDCERKTGQLCWKYTKCPPKLKVFLWRVLDNLPVRENLARRGMAVDPSCPLCHGDLETTSHLFLHCPRVQLVWAKVGVDTSALPQNSLIDSWASILETDTDGTTSSRVGCMWGIWKFQNALVFCPDDRSDLEEEVQKAIKLTNDFHEANAKLSEMEAIPPARWQPPAPGWIQFNSDTGIGESGKGQIGVVVRDHRGGFIAAALELVNHTYHPTVLEAMGVQLSVRIAISMGFPKVVLESDCQPVIHALQGSTHDRSDLTMILEDINERRPEFEDISFSFVRRQANNAAHAIAKSSLPSGSLFHFYSTIPQMLSDTLSLDMM